MEKSSSIKKQNLFFFLINTIDYVIITRYN